MCNGCKQCPVRLLAFACTRVHAGPPLPDVSAMSYSWTSLAGPPPVQLNPRTTPAEVLDGATYNDFVRLKSELDLARAAAVDAGRLALRYASDGVVPESKLDLSPVTIADRESEKLIASRIAEAFPDDGILGEE